MATGNNSKRDMDRLHSQSNDRKRKACYFEISPKTKNVLKGNKDDRSSMTS